MTPYLSPVVFQPPRASLPTVDKPEVLRYLGYGGAAPDPTVDALVDCCIDELIEAVGSVIYADLRTAELLIPYAQGQISSYLCEKCTVHRMDYRDEGTYFSVDLNTADYNRLTPYFI